MNMASCLKNGQFMILSEVEPPKGIDVSEMLAGAEAASDVVDAFIVPEMQNAVMRMSALGASLILRNNGFDVVMQVCTRDRNRLAIQGDLLAAHAAGISSLIVVEGDDPSSGDHLQARKVNDLNVPALLRTIRTLERGEDLSGLELTGAPDYCSGAFVSLDESGGFSDAEHDRMKKRFENGVAFFLVPPMAEAEPILPLIEQAKADGIPIIPTVLVLKSMGMAKYLKRNFPEIPITDALVNRIMKSKDKVGTCSEIAMETMATIKAAGAAGLAISAIGWEDRIPLLAGRLKTAK